MAQNTVRSVVVFSVIALIFISSAVGGVFWLKSRNSSLATTSDAAQTAESQAQPSAEAQAETQPEQAAGDQAANSSAEETSAPQAEASTDGTTSETTTPEVAATDTTSDASDQTVATEEPATTVDSTADVAAATPQSVPATGPSPFGAIATLVLMMAAAFFGGQLFRARSAYRRYLQQ